MKIHPWEHFLVDPTTKKPILAMLAILLHLGTITLLQAQPIHKPATDDPTLKQSMDSVLVWHLSYRLSADVTNMASKAKIKNGRIPTAFKVLSKTSNRLEPKDSPGPALDIWVTDSLERVESVSMLGRTTFLIHKNDSLQRQLQLDRTTQTAYLGVMGLPTVSLVGDSVIIIDPKDFNLHLTDKTDTLLHMEAKYAYYDSNTPYVDKQINVWYTDKVPAIYWDKYNYLRALPGAALIILATVGKAQIGITLSAARQVLVAKDFFEVPSGYKLVDYSQLQQIDSAVDSTEHLDTTQDPPILGQD